MKRKIIVRWLGLLSAIFGLVLGSLTLATPAQASQSLCGNYGDSPSFGCVSYSGFSGQRTWGYPVDGNGHNCTNYAAYRISQNGAQNPGNLGNAHEWDNKASVYGIPVNNTPAVGSIAVWEINSWPALGSGHVAYVEAVTSTYIDISEDNYSGTTMRTRYFTGQSDWPDHFIHFTSVAGGQFVSTNYHNSEKHVFSVDASGKVRETWWTGGGPVSGVITTISGTPTGISSFIAGSYRHLYISTAQGPIYETYWAVGQPVTTWQIAWVQNTKGISALLHNGEKHVFTVDASGVIRETWWTGSGPQTGVITTVGGSPTGISSFISGSYRHVYVSTSGGPLYETYWSTTASASTWQIGWVQNATGVSVVFDGAKHVFTADTSGSIRETWWTGSGPQTGVITTVGGASITGITAYIAGAYRQVYTGTTTGKIYETYWTTSTSAITWQVM